MSHKIVKLFTDDYGEEYEEEEQVWHLSTIATGDPVVLCSGEFYGLGQSGCKFEEKIVSYGGITCNKCIEIIKLHKSLKLSKPSQKTGFSKED